jgi:hypothetical protein
MHLNVDFVYLSKCYGYSSKCDLKIHFQPHCKERVSIITTIPLMKCREILAVCSEEKIKQRYNARAKIGA